MNKKLSPTFFTLFLIAGLRVYAQQNSPVIKSRVEALEQYAGHHPMEKVHLHLDRTWYSLGDTIWFKAYVVIGAGHRLSALSKILYAELISPGDTVLKRLTLRLRAGVADGQFLAPYIYKPGRYRIRAYTNYMRNDSAYYDHRIIIGGAPSVLAKADDPGTLDIQFFPEGGYLVNGLRSRVAFKAINKSGTPVGVRGAIIDNDNNEVATFNTQYAGMGQFPLTPQAGKHYKASIICPDGSMFTVNLPDARDNGFVLTVNNAADSVYLQIAATGARFNSDTSFYLLAQSGGKVYFTAASKLTGPVFARAIAKSRFPTGIACFTLFSQSGEPMNERIVFIRNADSANLAITGNKESYAPGEKVRLNLEADTGTFSIAVTNETRAPADERAESSVFADLLLSPELKGYIENPDHYFADNSERTRNDLDLLMLTQGYRRFEWKKIAADEAPGYQPESALSLSGVIKTMGNKPIANGSIRLTSVKDMFSADTVSDSQGRFTFSNLYFSDSTKLVINAKKAKGGTSVKITINKPRYPAISHLAGPAGLQTDSLPVHVSEALKRSYVTGSQLYLKNTIQLREVSIKARRNPIFEPVYSDNMKFSSNLNGPGNADQVILHDRLMRSGGGLLSDILPGIITGITVDNGFIFYGRHLPNSFGIGAMALIIEGGQASPADLDNINPDDIYSIEVLTSGSNLAIYGSNAPGGALIITLRHGTDPVDVSKITVDGLITYTFNGFYKTREFYSPKYQVQTGNQPANERSTIYWNPDVITTNGKASVEYYNAGSPATYRVVIEGIDGMGNLYRKVFKYQVK